MFFVVCGQGNAVPLQWRIYNHLWQKKKKSQKKHPKTKQKTALLLHSPKRCACSAILLFSKYSMPSDFTFLPDVMIFSGHINLEPRIIYFSYHVLCLGSGVTDFNVRPQGTLFY